MKKVIYEYALGPDTTVLELPVGSKLLCAKVQHDRVVVWAEVPAPPTVAESLSRPYDPSQKDYVLFSIVSVPTGFTSDLIDNMTYLDTVMFEGGDLVFHIYFRKQS